MNDLRGRIRVQTDGKLQTGRDVTIAALLGAEEFGFSTAPLVAMGCIMMRKCHLNTCPVGIATQDPVLRAKFQGTPEHVINFFFFIAEQVRALHGADGLPHASTKWWAASTCSDARQAVDHWKAKGIDLSAILYNPPDAQPHRAALRAGAGSRARRGARLQADRSRRATPSRTARRSRSSCRSATCTAPWAPCCRGEIARRYGSAGLPDDTIHFQFTGSAGQSFGAFLAKGVTLELEGDANDYVGKGLSGGRLIVYPPRNSTFLPEENILIGNVVLYGATSGEAYFNGMAGERFAVRNSGATRGGGRPGRSRLRIHDQAALVVVLGKVRPQLRRRHERRHRLRARREGRFRREALQHGGASTWSRCWREDERAAAPPDRAATSEATGSPRAKWMLENWDADAAEVRQGLPARIQARAGHAAQAAACARGMAVDRRSEVCTWVKSPASWNTRARLPHAASARRAHQRLVRDLHRLSRREAAHAGRALHGLRRALLPHRLPADQHHSRLERSGVSRPLAAKPCAQLHATNNFPEFTGRICPAPCEAACVLGINEPPVTIKQIEKTIIDRAFEEGCIRPEPPPIRTGKRVAVVGSGPAGLAAAQQLARAGHGVTVFEKADRIGGLLRYGIPNFKMEKHLIDRRLEQMRGRGREVRDQRARRRQRAGGRSAPRVRRHPAGRRRRASARSAACPAAS